MNNLSTVLHTMAWVPHEQTKHTCQMLQQLVSWTPVLLRKGFRWTRT